MIELIFVLHNENERVHSISKRVKENSSEINDVVFSTMTAWGISEDIAIDCASWAELATVGESYALNNFDLYIEEY